MFQQQGNDGYPEQSKVSDERQKATSLSWTLKVTVGEEFEECLEFDWKVAPKRSNAESETPPQLRKSVVELVLNLQKETATSLRIQPPKDATVKRVEFGGKEKHASLQNMPEGRNFFVCVVGTFEDGSQSRSPWVRAATLHPDTRDQLPCYLNLDPLDKPRLACKSCPCIGYIATKWNQFAGAGKLRCRRCGCRYDRHVGVDVSEILQERERKARETLGREVAQLPKDAVNWDDRECMLWFLTEGAVHPRTYGGVGRRQPEDTKAGLGGRYGISGKPGRVSVVTPTTESRQQFHQRLWKCFEAQEWQDKELVVIETYVTSPSEFLEQLAAKEERLTYAKFKMPAERDWSIGLKRNIGANLATGEFIANFDDDDLYAPTYLSTMVGQLDYRKAQAITLSSWYIYDAVKSVWSFCDTIAWGLAQGKDEQAEEVKSWAYGYGFSYVNRRRASLEVPYDNKNMGEDYSFFLNLQRHKGDRSVQLFHDAFGICAHIQHGHNTSNTFPIRDASPQEIAELDVAPLARLVDPGLPNKNREGKASIEAHTAHGIYSVRIAPGSVVQEFIRHLEQQVGSSCDDMKLHLVPPPGSSSQKLREQVAARVLGIEALVAYLARTKHTWNEEAGASERRRLMLERVKCAMRPDDRIPLFISHVWLARPEEGAEAERQSVKALELDSGLESEPQKQMFIAEVEVQVFTAKSKRRVTRALLPLESTVETLRHVFGDDMPSTARVLDGTAEPFAAERPLKESEVLPKRIIVTEFNGRLPLYARFTKLECAKNLSMLKAFLLRPETQKSLDEAEKSVAGDEKAYRVQLSQILATEAYPAIFRHYGVEAEGLDAVFGIRSGMDLVGRDASLSEQQFEVEVLLRNRIGAADAAQAFTRICEFEKSPLPYVPVTVISWLEGRGPSIRESWRNQ